MAKLTHVAANGSEWQRMAANGMRTQTTLMRRQARALRARGVQTGADWCRTARALPAAMKMISLGLGYAEDVWAPAHFTCGDALAWGQPTRLSARVHLRHGS